jgi:benzylsuccinate CoA-transferase BbsF subunit
MNAPVHSNHLILSGIRILDFSWVLAGPYATRLLADFGAEVIKVQPLSNEDQSIFSRGYYNTWNRNKLGITLNMAETGGIKIAKRLIKISDIVVENFSPRVMANWGLDYSELEKLKPEIIMLSMSVMGQTGPWRDYSGFGPTVQAFSGVTYLTSYPGQAPLGIGYSYADHAAGLYASLALLGALEYRRQTGRGQYIDLSQTEAMSSLLADSLLDYSIRGQEAQPLGNISLLAAPHGVYPCRGEDRWCAIAVSSDKEWANFKRAIGNQFWANEERFATITDRLNNRTALDSLIGEWTQQHPAEEVMALLQKAGVPSGVVQNAEDLFYDPQFQARHFFLEQEHPSLGKTLVDANPIRLSDNPVEYRRTAPLTGQDNYYVYRQLLGMTEDEVEKLRGEGVI